MTMLILGLSAYYHDSAAALVRDGAIVARAPGGAVLAPSSTMPGFPAHAMPPPGAWRRAASALDDIDQGRLLRQAVAHFRPAAGDLRRVPLPGASGPSVKAMPRVDASQKLMLQLRDCYARPSTASVRGTVGPGTSCCSAEHHHSHAASAFYPSPFAQAAAITGHGRRRRVGDDQRPWASGRGSRVTTWKCRRRCAFPTPWACSIPPSPTTLGFEVNEGEYKVMGLAHLTASPKYVAGVSSTTSST